MKETLERLGNKFKVSDIVEKKEYQIFLTVDKKDLENVVMYLKEYEGYGHLTMISAVDHIDDGKFQVTYLLHDYDAKTDINIRVFNDRDNPSLTTINTLWAGARVYERELKEMFGIDFPGSPRVDEGFVLEGWDTIPPMRKDFDTAKYSEETFYPREGRSTKDPTKTMEEKLYPLESDIKKSITKTFRDSIDKK